MRAIDADALQLAIVEEGQANKRKKYIIGDIWELTGAEIREVINSQPTIQPEIVRCKDCKWWRQQTNYQGAPLSFGFCESDDMWRSLYGETNEVAHIDTDDDFYCGYAERREVTT